MIILEKNFPDNLVTGAKHPKLNITTQKPKQPCKKTTNIGLMYKLKTKPNEINPDLGAFYAIRPGNGSGLVRSSRVVRGATVSVSRTLEGHTHSQVISADTT